jgi:HPr kinase/phosphorylase
VERIVHASCVAAHGRAILIRGAAGSGKSALALELISRGAGLVADDRTILAAADGALIASCPASISGLIEARGMGLMRVRPVPSAPVTLVVDLDHAETARLPERRSVTLQDCALQLIHKSDSPHFIPALATYLSGAEWMEPDGRSDDQA